MKKNLREIYRVYEMLGSAESKKFFCAAIKGNITGKISNYRFAQEPQYFLEGFYPGAGDITIDGGAYDGATAIEFTRQGAKVYAFEMDVANYKKCLPRAELFGFTIENLGLSDKKTEAAYFSWGTSSSKNSAGNLRGKFIDLDTYVAEKNLPRVDYIKLDIEGAELEMLRGAAKTISRCKPKMAISVYHRADDLWILAPYIKSLRADYEFEFRHYKVDCRDYTLDDNERAILKYFGLSCFVPMHCELILYCK